MPLDVSRPDLSLAVIGTGVMGRGIAQIAAQAGIRALLHDSRPGAAQDAKESVSGQLAKLAEKGRLERDALARAQANLVVADSREALASCPIVIEAIVEDLETKRELFRSLEDIVSLDCLMASNTSSFSITAIAAACKRPERIAGFHFFNPVPLMKVVEVVDGLLTAPWVGEALAALALRCGHKPVRAKDTPGFIVNHAGRGYGTEAPRIRGEGTAEFPQVDRNLRDCAGFRLGPFELLDLTGLDVSHPVMESIYRQYYEEPRFRPSPLTGQRVAAGLLGRKSGVGFYHYENGKREEIPEPPAPAARPASVWVSRSGLGTRLAELVAKLGARVDAGAQPAVQSLYLVAPVGRDATATAIGEGLHPRRTLAVHCLLAVRTRRPLMATRGERPPQSQAQESRMRLARSAPPGVAAHGSRAHGARCGARVRAGQAAASRSGGVPPREDGSFYPPRDGSARFPGTHASRRIRRRRNQPRELRADRARAGARGFRLPIDDERAELARHDADPRIRLREAKEEIPAEARQRRAYRLLRPHRAQPRLRPGEHADAGEESLRRLQPRGLQDLDQQRADRRSLPHLREDRGRAHPRLPHRERREGALGARDPRQSGLAHLDHRRSRDGRRVRAGGEPALRSRRPERPVHLPERGALRNRLGRARRGRGLLAPRPSVRARPQAVRPAARREPADPEKARRHADRDLPGAAGRAALRPHEGRRHRYARDHLDHEAQLLRQGPGDRAPRARHAGRQRDLGRVRRGAPYGQPRSRQHLRRHARYPRINIRACPDGNSGFFVIQA